MTIPHKSYKHSARDLGWMHAWANQKRNASPTQSMERRKRKYFRGQLGEALITIKVKILHLVSNKQETKYSIYTS